MTLEDLRLADAHRSDRLSLVIREALKLGRLYGPNCGMFFRSFDCAAFRELEANQRRAWYEIDAPQVHGFARGLPLWIVKMNLLLVACVLASVGVASLAAANICLILVHLSYAKAKRREEAAVLASRVFGQTEMICVQLAVRNEEVVIRETLRALCRLEWPRDCLEILVLDDGSTDRTLEIAHAEVERWRSEGVNIRIFSQPDRATKGGLLRLGMSMTKARYFAIFDADYRPGPAFLTQLMPFFGEDPRIGFVQARLDFRNRNATWVTKAQALDLDTYYAFDQIGRTWSEVPVAYNGTCGIWRRAALEDAGGWTARSFLEDVDASFRAFAKGWSGKFVTGVTAPGHLPETIAGFATQRLRWSIGWHQQFSVMPLKSVLQRGLSNAIFFVLAFVLDTCGPLLVAVNVLLLFVAFLFDSSAFTTGLIVFLLSIALVLSTRAVGTLFAVRQCGRRIDMATIVDLFRVWALYLVMLPIALKAAVLMLGRNLPKFEQTPKIG